MKEIQQYLTSGSLSGVSLSPAQWSALVFILLTSEEELDIFDLKKYSASEEGLQRLMPVIKDSKTSLDSYEEVPNKEPVDSYEEVPNKEPVDSYEEVPNKEPVDSYEKVPNKEPVDSYEEVPNKEPVDSYEEVPNKEPVDSYEEPASAPSLHLDALSSAMSPLLRSPLAGSGPDLCYPLLLNASCRLSLQPRFTASLLYTLTFSLALLTVLLNLLLIVSIAHFRQLHTPTNLTLLSLAGSDLLIGLVVVPLEAQYYIRSCWFLGPWLCYAYYMLMYVLTSASVASILLISLDRYLAVCQPLRYTSEVTVGRVQLAVGLCWSCAVVYNGSLVVVNVRGPPRRRSCRGECVVMVDGPAGWVELLVTFLAPISTVVALYLQVFGAALFQARKMRSSRTAARRSELKAALRLGVVVVVFLLCYFPALGFMSQDASGPASSWSVWLVYLNSCLNPLLYALFYPWFRRTIRLIVTLQILKPNSSRASVLH
ncbi:unnamed protein product [Boreogadus saida]